MKNVLILCTGNSCRSIIAEAIINRKLKECVHAFSAGVNPTKSVNKNAQKVLESMGDWSDKYHSKDISKIIDIDFDLIITVCDNAKESCPMFPKKVEIVHIGIEDPDGKEYDEFIKTYVNIEAKIIPFVSNKFCKNEEKN